MFYFIWNITNVDEKIQRFFLRKNFWYVKNHIANSLPEERSLKKLQYRSDFLHGKQKDLVIIFLSYK